jgi:hypothetical protein
MDIDDDNPVPRIASVKLLEMIRHSKNNYKGDRTVIGALVGRSCALSRTELDSHANMVVLGKHCLLLSPHGKKMARVAAFSPTLEPMDIPIVTACIKWTDPNTDIDHFLQFDNALYVEQMEHNLLPPFILREAGWTVDEVPHIHTDCVTENTHAIIHERRGVKISLHLHGVFSYFTSTKPSQGDYNRADRGVLHWLTPITHGWNPNQDNYAMAEDSYLDWRGQLVPIADRERVIRKDTLLDVSSVDAGWIKSEDESGDPNITQRYR